MKIAFIVQRYGAEILGGAEYHCRLIAERLAESHQVEVLTTCARDYVTWKNEYAEGADRLRGVTVRRFATARTRDIDAFNRYSDWIFSNRHGRAEELEWLKQQGPWSPALIEYLERQHQQYDVLIFFTYLYAPTVLGIRIAPWKSLLVPTAHDEPAIRLGIYEEVFASAAAIAWNTDVERRFVSSMFRLGTLVEDVVGCGVDLPEGEDPQDGEHIVVAPPSREALAPHLEGPANAFRRRHRIHTPFVLYGGRIDPGKGCEELLEYFQSYVKEGGDMTLMLMGTKLMPLPEDPQVRFAGLLPDAERLHALEAATVVVVPSPHESLSLLALEAFAAGTPVLANARAEVLVEHCRRSNAGLYYADRWEFIEALKLLQRDATLRAGMGANGRQYVGRHYRWGLILEKYERLFARLRESREDAAERPSAVAKDRERRDRDRLRSRPRGQADRRRFHGDRERRRERR
ncbi:MAG: glycosyltransferase family 4 protein [Acidobacteria bacterium]|nr:glycosyltransferase family 4 protein [Acidobacteriota bacterium]